MATERSNWSALLRRLTGMFRASQKPPLALPVAVETSTLLNHWAALRAQGFTAVQLIEYLQPIADLEGISVSYAFKNETTPAQVYHHSRMDAFDERPSH